MDGIFVAGAFALAWVEREETAVATGVYSSSLSSSSTLLATPCRNAAQVEQDETTNVIFQ